MVVIIVSPCLNLISGSVHLVHHGMCGRVRSVRFFMVVLVTPRQRLCRPFRRTSVAQVVLSAVAVIMYAHHACTSLPGTYGTGGGRGRVQKSWRFWLLLSLPDQRLSPSMGCDDQHQRLRRLSRPPLVT